MAVTTSAEIEKSARRLPQAFFARSAALASHALQGSKPSRMLSRKSLQVNISSTPSRLASISACESNFCLSKFSLSIVCSSSYLPASCMLRSYPVARVVVVDRPWLTSEVELEIQYQTMIALVSSLDHIGSIAVVEYRAEVRLNLPLQDREFVGDIAPVLSVRKCANRRSDRQREFLRSPRKTSA